MPLPIDTCLTLLPHTNPGESDCSRPKQAMIVRMSAESLEALYPCDGEQPPLEFEFGDISGIHIAGHFYSMRPVKEDTAHELYLRTTSAAKHTGPLKHYANVIGKFTVERELGNKVKDMLREKTSDAAKQKDDRRTIFVDSPPTISLNKTKKKDQPLSMFRNTTRPVDQTKCNSSSTAPAKPNAVDASPSLRRRLVQFLALSERPQETIVRMVVGADCDSTSRRDLLVLLEAVAELTSPVKRGEDVNARLWRLKTEAWKEVRPFEWPKLQEKERIAMARTGRQKLSSLGIKDSDPLWEHFTYRPAAQSHPPEPSTSKVSNDRPTEKVAKRGVTSKELKEKKIKPKAVLDTNIQAKNESAKATASGTSNKIKELDITSQPVAKPAVGRKLPGTGFKLRKTTPTISAPNLPVVPEVQPASAVSLPPKPPPCTFQIHDQVRSTQRMRKAREAELPTDSDQDKVLERSREKEKGRSGINFLENARRAEGKERSSQKRKQAPGYDGDSDTTLSKSNPHKKRKIEAASDSAAISQKEIKLKDLSLPRKSEVGPSGNKGQKEQSSLLPPKKKSQLVESSKMGRAETPPQKSQTDRKTKGTSKLRREHPIYTSSEDEGPQGKASNGSLLTPPSNNCSTSTTSALSPLYPRRYHSRELVPLPKDHGSIRARYKATYSEYLMVYQKMFTQRGKIQNLLEGGDASNSDGDPMDSEELSQLSRKYHNLHEELVALRSAFENNTG